jgi:EpsI family protein
MTDDPNPPTPGVKFSRRDFVVGAALASVSVAGFAAQPKVVNPRVANSKFASWIPERVGPWLLEGTSGVVMPPPDALSDRLYDNLATRVYKGPGGVDVMMVIAYNYKQDGVVQLHRPEFCYEAGGFRISPTVPVAVPLANGREIPASTFTAVSAARTEQVLFITRLGASFPTNWVGQRASVLWANLKGEIPDGTLFRVSVFDTDHRRALDVLRGFISAFIEGAPPQLNHMLIRDPK